MMIEIQDRIEARKVARNLEIAGATMEELKASKNKKDGEKKVGASRGSKKATASQSAAGVTATEPVASLGAVPRKSTPESTAAQETVVATVPTLGRISKRAVVKSREDGALSTLKFSAITEIGSWGSEPTEDVAGIALVASTLGKMVPRVTLTHNAAGMTDCYIEIQSTRTKAKTPASVAPPNSIDSDDAERGDTGSEVQLCQSDVHIGFPRDISGTTANTGLVDQSTEETVGNLSTSIRVCPEASTANPGNGAEARSVAPIAESDGVAVLGNAMSGVAAHEEVSDAPIAPGEVATPVSESAHAAEIVAPSVLPEAHRTPTTTVIIPGSAEEKAARKIKYDCKQKMLREIAANQLLQEELAKTDPNLVSISSFMNRVCGTDRGARLLKETAESVIQKGIAEKLTAETSKQKGTTVNDEALTPTTGLAKEPSGESTVVVTLGESSEVNVQTTLVTAETCETDACEIAIIADARDDPLDANDSGVIVGDAVAQGPDESDAIFLDGTVMSIGGSSSDGSPGHSTCGSSVSASESRKRTADESPNRVAIGRLICRGKFASRLPRTRDVQRCGMPRLYTSDS